MDEQEEKFTIKNHLIHIILLSKLSTALASCQLTWFPNDVLKVDQLFANAEPKVIKKTTV